MPDLGTVSLGLALWILLIAVVLLWWFSARHPRCSAEHPLPEDMDVDNHPDLLVDIRSVGQHSRPVMCKHCRQLWQIDVGGP